MLLSQMLAAVSEVVLLVAVVPEAMSTPLPIASMVNEPVTVDAPVMEVAPVNVADPSVQAVAVPAEVVMFKHRATIPELG